MSETFGSIPIIPPNLYTKHIKMSISCADVAPPRNENKNYTAQTTKLTSIHTSFEVFAL